MHRGARLRERAAARAYPCPYCGTRQTYAERTYPHHCKSCGRRIVWASTLGTIKYEWVKA